MNAPLPARNAISWIVAIAVLLAAGVAGSIYGAGPAILTLAGGALTLVIWLLWSSVQSLTGESELSFEEALNLGSRSVEEEQKRAVLRALKDLEYERSVGKISEQDYAEFTARYRAEAKQLMRQLDESLGAARKQVEGELARRLGQGPAEPSEQQDAAEPVSGPAAAEPSPLRVLRACAACQAENELDARFCKKCGAALASAGERLCAKCPARFAVELTVCPECDSPAEESA